MLVCYNFVEVATRPPVQALCVDSAAISCTVAQDVTLIGFIEGSAYLSVGLYPSVTLN